MKNLTDCSTFGQLVALHHDTRCDAPLSSTSIHSQLISSGPLHFSYAGYHLSASHLSCFQALAQEQAIFSQWGALLSGEKLNYSENRAIHHHRTRSPSRGKYGQEQARFSDFAAQVRHHTYTSGKNQPFTAILQIGIGGSHLGPEAVFKALKGFARQNGIRVIPAYFLVNSDPDDWADVSNQIDLATTLVIVVSKSGSTQETGLNQNLVRSDLKELGWTDAEIRQNCVSVTTRGSQLDRPDQFRDSFYIDDEIGGRFSVTSAVGGVLLSTCFGPDVFESLLQGAYLLDQNASCPEVQENMSACAALLTIWERNVLKVPAVAVIPYSHPLSRFPAHLQQLICESNGKQVNRQGHRLEYATAPIIFGEPGTACQHSFFQKIHQGTDLIPVQFIGFTSSQTQNNASQNTVFLSNLIAQMVALSTGQRHEDLNKVFDGNRPHSLLYAPSLTPESMGAILAFYENKVVFESFLWNINAFDQEGVQLGKVLANQVLDCSGERAELLKSYQDLLQSCS